MVGFSKLRSCCGCILPNWLGIKNDYGILVGLEDVNTVDTSTDINNGEDGE